MTSNVFSRIENGELFLIAGPCVVESEQLCLTVAERLAELANRHKLPYIFKSSYKKANRLSASSFTGPGVDEGLSVLAKVKASLGLPILTDIHETTEILAASDVADVLQIPAFLCRQTDLVVAAGKTGRWVNIKKGQFLAPEDMALIAAKTGTKKTMLTERGTTFGYRNLVVDFRSLVIMRQTGLPVVFDVTHSLQIPGGGGTVSGGQPQYSIPLAKAAVAVGVNGLFIETHPDPRSALSDAGAMVPLDEMPKLIEACLRVRDAVQ
ncbi:MAG: 3-deoxy-8-phosphooctulonate synthase [Candidatus Zixiibacteriota bacterium]